MTRPRSHSWGRRGRLPNINMSIKPGSVFHGASQVVLEVNNRPASAGDTRETGSIPGSIPWRRKWQPTPLFLPGESHGQRSLAGYGP